MKKALPPFPELSPAFTLEDIRKIRDYNHDLYQILTPEEIKEYRSEGYERAKREIAERRALGVKTIRPKRIPL